ncbi:MAG: hypothetical protein ACODAE_04550 [Gemmatimonadota bacterium]
MDSSAVPVFLAGPFPVLHSARVDPSGAAVELDVALLIGGMPTVLATTGVPADEEWDRIRDALDSGDARLGVAGIPHEATTITGAAEVYPSAFVGLECANGERLVLAHIRGPRPGREAEAFARRVIKGILRGRAPAELGRPVSD